ncbi:hypothetical protein J7T55_004410 [Diaporthe amygdali]|uniref:uncharacterized protein n=1 Tax=Phomopsis amygdali TaxID=1214568 RepID=UPI0022FEF994|nr:uncharacterized protein J7T55_004410 [Diaporthe amygdali]KAJ0109860.1 hypothetical protein J7T55_004410 [Diaporthe amygdali]
MEGPSSSHQPTEHPAWFTHCSAPIKLPNVFIKLPKEIQDQILRHILCVFPRPETSDPANNGRYIGEHSRLAQMPWEIDTRILELKDPGFRGQALRLMLTTNQFICVKSESVNLLPIFHAAQIPIVALGVGEWSRDRVEELSRFFILTHRIERVGGVRASITRTCRPWGRSNESLYRLGLSGKLVPQRQEFVILRRDLDLFCRALDGADSGYHRFGECTQHILTFHGPFDDILDEDVPVLHPSCFLQPYSETLRGFKNFTVQGRIRSELAQEIKDKVGPQVSTPRVEDVLDNVDRQMSQGDDHLSLSRPMMAAHTYARASQELIWLYSKGILPLMADESPDPALSGRSFELDLQQGNAWLIMMQKKREATESAGHKRLNDAHDRGDPTSYSSFVELVINAVMHKVPPPLVHKASIHQFAIRLYQAAKAERLGDCGSRDTWANIQSAVSKAPQDEEIRREAALIRRCIQPWSLTWIPEAQR